MRSFQISPSPGYTLPILITLLCLPLIGPGVAIATESNTDELHHLWPVALIVPAVFWLFLYAYHRRTVTLHDGLLVVRAGLRAR